MPVMYLIIQWNALSARMMEMFYSELVVGYFEENFSNAISKAKVLHMLLNWSNLIQGNG